MQHFHNCMDGYIYIFFALRFGKPYDGVKVAFDKGLVKATKEEVFTWPPTEYREGGAQSEQQEGEGTEEESLPLLVKHDREKEIEDTYLCCRCCKRSCRCQEKLKMCQGSCFVSQLNCGGVFCSFEISLFKQGAPPTGGEQ